MRKKIKLSRKKVQEINRKNAHGKPWVNKDGSPINPDHIIKCYDMYKQGRMTSRQLLDHFKGRTIKAIESKVWKIRGRAESHEYDDPRQEDMFRNLLNG